MKNLISPRCWIVRSNNRFTIFYRATIRSCSLCSIQSMRSAQKQINNFDLSMLMSRIFVAILVFVLLSGSIVAVNAQPPAQRAPASEPVILDADKNPLCFKDSCDLTVNQRVFIKSTITNQIQPQSFVYIVKVTDSEGVTVLLSWVNSKLGKYGSGDFIRSWIPDKVGHYTIETFVWDSLDVPVALSPTRSVKASVLSQQTVKCDGKLVPRINYKNDTATIPVLLMQPNSTATVCVTYQILLDWATYPNKDVYTKGIAHFALTIGRNGKHAPPDLFRVTAIPNMLNVTDATNHSNFTILYKIYATPNSKGFYDYSVPAFPCESYPLAVGYAATQVHASDFPFVPIGIPCPALLFEVDSVRISDMDYTKIVWHPPPPP